MSKVALLIGVSEYLPDLKPLPAAVQDVEAIQAILQNPEIGHFDEVKTLINPVSMEMQEAIEALFTGRAKDDLVLLFFSGHGIKDDNGRLFFATRSTRKHPNGELVKATTVPASFVHDVMNYSRSKRQVVVLDCCFGGAFAEGLAAKDDGSIDVRSQLGGEGRAILTSSASTQYSFEQAADRLSIYTRYLVEGIETGLADLDNDGMISVDELHEYASSKVREVTTAMKPEIYAVKEGFKIHLVHAPVSDPQSRYRKEVERFAQQGEISEIARTALEVQREKLGLSYREATLIEAEVIEPYREHRYKLQRYRQVFDEAIRREFPLSDRTRNELKLLQQTLNLIDEDIASLEARITHSDLDDSSVLLPPPSSSFSNRPSTKVPRFKPIAFVLIVVVGLIASLSFYVWMQRLLNSQSGGSSLLEQTKLQKAEELANQGKFNEAINLAQEIRSDAHLLLQAQELARSSCRELLGEYRQDTIQFSKKYGQSQTEQVKANCLKVGVDFGAG